MNKLEAIDLRDIPIRDNQEDLLNLDQYAQALVHFLMQADTPITVSLQGEWGSGKTSLMNLVNKKLAIEYNPDGYEAIWIDTWEFFINEDKEALEKIILSVINDITKIGRQKSEGYKNDLLQVFEVVKNFSKKTVDVLLSTVGVDQEGRKSAFDLLNPNQITLVKNLRNTLEKWVVRLVEGENQVSNKGFIFFIDDLDRIEPEKAVQILEIFKNIFNIRYCIFVLAIDYEVVVKGLKRKYGEYQEKDEADFKAYFDKLVQLPFVMPVSSYDIRKLLTNSLLQINYIEKADELCYLHYSYMVKAIKYTIGNNPRRIKRMINALHLSYIYDEAITKLLKTPQLKLLNTILICLQQGYQQIYNFLSINPDFKTWKETDFAVQLTKSQIDDTVLMGDDLSQEWEITLYKVCVSDPSIEEKATNILSVFSILDKLLVEKEITVNDIKRIQKISALTNFSYRGEKDMRFEGRNYDKSSQTQYSQSQFLIQETKVLDHSLILDIGCGNGKTTIALFQKNPTCRIVAFDLSESQIDMAIENRNSFGLTREQIFFYTKDAFDMNEEDKYNLIFSNATLHWIVEGKEMYTKIYQALKENGSIAIHQGGKDSYIGLHQAVQSAIKHCDLEKYYHDWTYPIFYPAASEMKEMLEDIGFVDIEIKDVITDGKEFEDLVDNFANASLLPYLSKIPKNKTQELKNEYFEVCRRTKVDTYTHRLYIFARKGK